MTRRPGATGRIASLLALGRAVADVGTGTVAPGRLRSERAAREASRRLAVAPLTPVTDRDSGPDPYVFGPPGPVQRTYSD